MYETRNPIGSFDPRDLLDNSEVLDNLVTGSADSYPDRLGVVRKSWRTIEAVAARFADFRNASEFGAVPGGDLALAVQLAHDAGVTNLIVDSQKYKWDTAVTITHLMNIQGGGYLEGPNAADGSWAEISKTGFKPLTFTGANARGSSIRGIAFWESNHPGNQVAGWAPTDNDFIINVIDCLGSVDIDVFMVRVNRGVYCLNSGRLNIEKIKGQWYTRAIEVDNCLDIPRINYLHAWTFYTTNQYVLAYQQANLDVLVLKRVDGIFLGNIFALGCRSWMRLDSSANGVPTKIYNDAGYADFSRYGIWVPAGANNVTVQIAQLTVQGEDVQNPGIGVQGGAAIRVDADNASIQIGLLHTQRHYQSAFYLAGQGNRVDVGELWVERANQANDGSPIFTLVNNTGAANQVNLTGGVRVTDSGTPPVINGSTNGSLMLSAVANRGNGDTDEPRSYWGNGEANIAAVSPNANSSMSIGGKGPNGRAGLKSNGKRIFSVDDSTGNGAGSVLMRSTSDGVAESMEGGPANLNRDMSAKGTGKLRWNSPVQFPGFAFASVPAAASYTNGTIRITDRNNRLATSDGTNWRFQDGAIIS